MRFVERGTSLLLVRHEQLDLEAAEGIEEQNEKRRALEFAERLARNVVTFRHLGQYGDESKIELANLALSRCHACQGFTIWVEDKIIYPVKETTIAAHEDLPEPIRSDFEEAASIVNRSPRGAAALLRLCIQKLMVVLGEKGENINDDIASLVKKGLDVDIQRALDIVRVIGNSAVHPGTIDLKDDKATAVKLFELLNIIVEREIATPKRIAALFDGLPPTALAAIQKRDGKP
jgi:Domain of unknown function (DUF4145)